MEKVFVVVGGVGKYSDRSIWVSGVYKTKDAAQAVILDRMAKRREFDQWYERKVQHQRQLQPPIYHRFPLSPEQAAQYDAINLAAEKAAGPKPEYEPADRVELFEVPIGVWQTENLNQIEYASRKTDDRT